MSGEDHHWRRVGTFMSLAGEELGAAQLLIETNPRQAAFFQQQAVEKLVRAVIEFERIVAGPTHSIGLLADLLGKGHAMHERFKAFDELSTAAARFRYPTGHGSVPNVFPEDLKPRQTNIELLMSEVVAFIGPLPSRQGNKNA